MGFGLNFHVCPLFKERLVHIGEWHHYSKSAVLQTCCRNRSYIIKCEYFSVTSCDLEGDRLNLRSDIQAYAYYPYHYVNGGYMTVLKHRIIPCRPIKFFSILIRCNSPVWLVFVAKNSLNHIQRYFIKVLFFLRNQSMSRTTEINCRGLVTQKTFRIKWWNLWVKCLCRYMFLHVNIRKDRKAGMTSFSSSSSYYHHSNSF